MSSVLMEQEEIKTGNCEKSMQKMKQIKLKLKITKMSSDDDMTTHDKLCYYSKSAYADVGKGKHEFVNNYTMYNELNKIPNWRRILSNFYTEPFIFEGKTYNSVEHAFQSYKISLVDKTKADYFTLESNHPIGK